MRGLKLRNVEELSEWSASINNTPGVGTVAEELGTKAPSNSPTFTGTVTGITAAMVGAPTGSGTSTGTNTGDQDLSSKQNLLVSGTNIKTINGASVLGSGDITLTTAGVVTRVLWEDRANLRLLLPTSADLAVVEGLGIYSWVSGSTELDDDETCFATTVGCWVLTAVSPEYAALSASSDDQLSITRSTFDMTLLSISPGATVDFIVYVHEASESDCVVVSPPNSGFGTGTTRVGLVCCGYVTSLSSVTVSFRNSSNSSINMTPSLWSVTVIKN
jgi:hypothetical protein